jgi:heterodisulfide reductase subunit C
MDEKLRIHDLDPLFKEELAREPGCQHLLRCFSCGVCTASCPVAEIEPGFNPSRIIRQVLYGMRAAVLAAPDLWYCIRCATCSFQCPQDVRFADVIQGLRNMAMREGVIPPETVARLEQGEGLVRELRRRLIFEVLNHPRAGENLKATLARLVKKLELP